MDIYLTEISNKKSKLRFPSLPETIKVKAGARYQSFDIIGQGTVKIPRGSEVSTVTWSGTFFGKAKRKEIMIRKWKAPKECKKILTQWMNKGTVLRLLVTGTNINRDVTISDFEYEEYGAYGNADYTITFCQHRTLKVYTTDELKIAAYEKKTVPRAEPEPSRTHTVVSGDTLWRIAMTYLGSGTAWPNVYAANTGIIEETANQYRGGRGSDNGHWIYPGTVLVIP